MTIESDNLAKLALRAATQLDRLERGLASDLAPLQSFTDAIEQIYDPSGGAGDGGLFLGSEIFGRAISQATTHKVDDIDGLNTELKLFLDQMRAVNVNQDDGQAAVVTMKNFCLFVHDFVMKARSANGLFERGVFDYDYSYVE
jgi:hypothetical protein